MDEAAIPHAIELLVGLLALAAAVAVIARPLRVPYTVALVVAGLLVGIGAAAAGFPAVAVSPEVVLVVLLPGLVFEAAYRLRVAELRRWFGGLALLAVPGVLISAAVVAIALYLGTGLRLDLAFIVGAMVSATDPAAVVATFKRVDVPPALSTMVDGESLLNDGTGLVLFAIAVGAIHAPIGPVAAITTFVGTVALSVAIGLVTGFVAVRATRLVDDHLVELTISVALAYGSYVLADQPPLSGVIATVTAANGQAAIEVIQARNDIQCIILDLMMPEVDGRAVIAYLAGSGRRIAGDRELRRLRAARPSAAQPQPRGHLGRARA